MNNGRLLGTGMSGIGTTRKSSALQLYLQESGGQLTLGGREREDRT
jgi:hypothetical protein